MLNAELADTFLEAIFDFFNSEMAVTFKKEASFEPESSVTTQEVNILLGVTGEAHGQIIYSMSQATARNIAVGLIGEQIDLLDELAQSAICELGNMVSGLAIQKLGDRYTDLAVTPPTLIIGKNMMLSMGNISRLCIILKSDIGKVELTLALREKEINRFEALRAAAAKAKADLSA